MRVLPRGLVSFLAVCAFGFERFAWYSLRAEFVLVFTNRGLDRLDAAALYASVKLWSLVLPLLFAVLAIAIPRAAIAATALLVAAIGIGVCVLGPPAWLVPAMWSVIAGTSAFKAVAFTACAEFVSSPRMKVALSLFAYAALNVGGFAGPALADYASPSFRGALVGYLLAALLALLSLGLSIIAPSPVAPVGRPHSMAGAVVLMLVGPSTIAMWVAYEVLGASAPMSTPPLWTLQLNAFVVVGLTMVAAGLVALAPARLLPSLGVGSVLLGEAVVVALVTCILIDRPQSLAEGVGLMSLASVAEIALGAVSLALCLALASPRFAPVLLASFTLATSLNDFLAGLPLQLVKLSAGSLLLLGLALVVVLVLLRKQLVGPLGESLVPARTAS